MRFRPLWLALVLVALPSSAFADDHRADFFLGASFAHASSLVGVHGTAAWFSESQPRLGLVVGDVSIHKGTHGDSDITRKSVMVGARLALPLAHTSGWKHVPSVQVLLGAVGSGTDDGRVAAGAVSVLWDFIPRPSTTESEWAFRVQADYVVVGDVNDYPRLSAGIVYRYRD